MAQEAQSGNQLEYQRNQFMKCPSECNMAKPEKKKAVRKAHAFKYKASVEEVDDEEDEE